MQSDRAPLPWTFPVAATLSLWLGWGIRGNYGHEYGAMIPGAPAGLAAAAMAVLLDWAVVRAIYGDRFAGHAGLHIRFGPNATIHR